MAYVSPDATSTTMPILALRSATLGAFAYTTIQDSVEIVVADPNAPGGTAPQVPNAVAFLWPDGDGTPSAA